MKPREMIPVMEALNLVIRHAPALDAEPVHIDRLPGLVLADDVAAPADIPPSSKSIMDGYALRSSDANAGAKLPVTARVLAGERSDKEIGAGECIRIMTGAELPNGADAVVKIEDTDGGEKTVELRATVSPGANVLKAGAVMKAGEIVLHAGRRVRVQDMPAIGAMNNSFLNAFPLPDAALVSSGDEIVDVGAPPDSSKVPDSNRHTLTALLRRDGIEPDFLGIASDRVEAIRLLVRRGLEKKILIFSGGVSMGDADLVAGVFESEGVKTIFTGVMMKPGKPAYFGVKDSTAVFGLPGNPLSVFVTYHLFVRSAIWKMAGRPDLAVKFERARFVGGALSGADRTAFHPARAFYSGRDLCVSALSNAGSADVGALARSNAFLVIDPAPYKVTEGDEVEIFPINPDLS